MFPRLVSRVRTVSVHPSRGTAKKEGCIDRVGDARLERGEDHLYTAAAGEMVLRRDVTRLNNC